MGHDIYIIQRNIMQCFCTNVIMQNASKKDKKKEKDHSENDDDDRES